MFAAEFFGLRFSMRMTTIPSRMEANRLVGAPHSIRRISCDLGCMAVMKYIFWPCPRPIWPPATSRGSATACAHGLGHKHPKAGTHPFVSQIHPIAVMNVCPRLVR